MPRTIAPIASVIFFGLLSSPVLAQYEVEQQPSVWLRALVDVRVVQGGPALSWTEGGPGKTRYGGRETASGFERATRFALSQLAVQMGASLPWEIRAQAQLNVQHDIADSYHPWLVEAILRREWLDAAQGIGVQSGVMSTPFSLEHVGPAWTPQYTISASALNTWLWEDISLAGLETEWWRQTESGIRLGALVGAGFGADQVGKLLALRGWVLGDTVAGVNGDLRLPGSTDRQDIFVERDHRPAVYSWLTLGDTGQIATANLGFFDNDGNQDDAGVWHTHFYTVGLTLHPLPRIDLLAQYLDGTARVHAATHDSALSAFYVLLSAHYGRERVSLRYDSFRVHDLEGGTPSTSESGDAVTAAFIVEPGLRHRIAFEYIWLHSRRAASTLVDPTPDGWQLSYRFRY